MHVLVRVTGLCCGQLKDFSSAIRDYTRALEVDPTNAYAFYNRGISHDRNGDFAEAIVDFTSAIGLLNTNADFYHNRGFCHRKKVCMPCVLATPSVLTV